MESRLAATLGAEYFAFASKRPRRADGSVPRASGARRTLHDEGYTMIELLVVLALIGLATSLALPAFFRWTGGAEARADESLVLTELSGLGFRAWASGQAVVLDDEHARVVLRRLPPSWQAHVETPIMYASSGACNGGKIAFVDAAGEPRAFRLAPMTCDAVRE